MKVEYAFLCQKAERESSESINAFGIGTRCNMRIPTLPCSPIIFVVAVISMELQENTRSIVKISIEDKRGNVCMEHEGLAKVQAGKDGRSSYLSIVADIEVLIKTLGQYTAFITINDKPIHELTFTVESDN